MRVPIRFGRLKPLFIALGMTPSRCYLELLPARTLGVPIGLRRLAIAVDHPERLLAELGAGAGEKLS